MKIIICGGGTAGWLAALMIKKVQPTHEITVIESSKIGIVGAGEGSTGYLTDIIQGNSWDYGCNEEDFFRETGATVKLGIRHRDWKNLGHEYIGPIDGTNSSGLCDYMLMHALEQGLPFHTASYNGYLIEHGSSSFSYNKDTGLINTRGHAYHFDAHLVGKYFKKICGNQVTHIDTEILQVNVDEQGHACSVTCRDGLQVDGDFFIDCSGFARVFLAPMGNTWKSYKEHLPVNAAMPFLLPHKEDEKIDPVTTAWAQTAGWMWQIPVQSRKGCGYVFDDRFISNEQAQQEIEQVLGHDIEPIRFLKFDTGRTDRAWVKNVLWTGLSAAFAEPLEATSIHSTIVQLQSFIFEYLRDTKEETCNQGSINIYNRRTAKMYDDFKDFLVLHYASQRTDSEFWRWMKTGETHTDAVKNLLELAKTRHPQPTDFDGYHGYAGASLYNWVLAGLGHITPAQATRDLDFYGRRDIVADAWLVHDYNMKKTVENTVANTEFVKNIDNYLHGHSIS
jgi:tryptophan 6-halogenase